MILEGVAPLLVITLKNKGIIDFFGPGTLLDDVVEAIGLPIPIYLSEQLTGVYVDNESSSIDVVTKIDPVTDKGLDNQVKTPAVSQTSGNSSVSINLFARKDSVLLTALLALMDMIVNRLVSQEYSIHYLNGPTAIFGAKLARFSKVNTSGTDLITMQLDLSTASKESPTPEAPTEGVGKIVGSSLGPS